MSTVLAFQLQTWNFFFRELVSGLAVGSLYALIALGYTMVYGVLKLLNFAHGDVYMIGAYIGFFVLNALGSPLSPVMPIVNAVRNSSPMPELPGCRLKVSYERGFGLQRRTAVCWRKNDTPIALMSGAIRGALRSGR